MPAMAVRLGIGDFSRMTLLSVKALRHYHDVGVLEPAEIDPHSGYRFYTPAQVPVAQVIRRLRDLGMPLDEIRAVLQAPHVYARHELITAHAKRMEARLATIASVVDTLHGLLLHPPATVAAERRAVGPTRALAVADKVAMADLDAWWDEVFRELDAALAAASATPAGPRAGLYPAEFFRLDDGGEVVAYVPVAGPVRVTGRVRPLEIPAAELAIAVHHGGFGNLDSTYGALGTWVAEREIGLDGPIREQYIVSAFDTDDESRLVTEVCWPVFHTH